jgi:hypothetical protein
MPLKISHREKNGTHDYFLPRHGFGNPIVRHKNSYTLDSDVCSVLNQAPLKKGWRTDERKSSNLYSR